MKTSNIPLKRFEYPTQEGSPAYMTQGYGGNPHLYVGYGLKGHNGIDAAYAKLGPNAIPWNERTVAAIEEGITVRARWDDPASLRGGFGQYARVYTPIEKSVLTNVPAGTAFVDRVYAHFGQFRYDGNIFQTDGLLIKEGDYVKRGQIIGIEGSTGNSTGPHVHQGTRFLDKNYTIINYNNGYFGYVDSLEDFFLTVTINRMLPVFMVKTDPNKTIWTLNEGEWVGFKDWPAFQSWLNGRPYQTLMVDQVEFDKLKRNPQVIKSN